MDKVLFRTDHPFSNYRFKFRCLDKLYLKNDEHKNIIGKKSINFKILNHNLTKLLKYIVDRFILHAQNEIEDID